jgi:hypothetical protein
MAVLFWSLVRSSVCLPPGTALGGEALPKRGLPAPEGWGYGGLEHTSWEAVGIELEQATQPAQMRRLRRPDVCRASNGRNARSEAVGKQLEAGCKAAVGQFPLCPQKRTFVSASSMSALCHKRTSVRYYGAVKERHPPRENGLPRWHIVGNGQCDPLAYQA